MILIARADARRLPLRDASFDCVVTSPPYFGLRDYGSAAQIGLEATIDEYVGQLVAVFREVRRVLRPAGTLWLNLGDSYATGAGRVGSAPGGGAQGERWRGGHEGKHGAVGPMTQPNRMPQPGLKQKDLIGAPWRVAFALQADGWWLRSDIVWAKPNPMPESVKDRPTRSHEYLFLLAKSERYYYDADAIREPHSYGNAGDHHRNVDGRGQYEAPGQPAHRGLHAARGFDTRPEIPGQRERRSKTSGPGPHAGGRRQEPEPGEPGAFHPNGRNARTVWTISTQPYSGSHFATFPEELARRCILAGCPRGGVVLDPFAGSGTVGRVAVAHGRHAVLADIAYQDQADKRTRGVQMRLEA